MQFFLSVLVILQSFHFAFNHITKCKTSFDPISTVDCSNMNITTLDQNIERIKDLTIIKKLVMSFNELNSSASFKSWTSLVALDVSYNKINNISSGTFGPLSRLKLLNISFNDVSAIEETSFDNMTLLEILDLSGNPGLGDNFESVQKSLNGVLSRRLKKLSIASANLSTLNSDTFKFAQELEYLDLSNNNLTLIPQLPKSLVFLKLTNNHIKSIGIVPFKDTLILKDLYLDNNLFLNDIDIDAFENLRSLRTISFKGCKSLEYFPPRLFDFSKKLNHVSLAECNLKTMPYEYKHVFINIQKIELDHNPWVCNDSIKWFAFLESSQDENLRCATPYNTSIAEYYGATIRHGVLKNIMIVLVFTVFVLFGMSVYVSFAIEKKRRVEMPYFPLETQNNPLVNRVYVTTVV